MHELPKRDEVPVNLTWDLSHLYPHDEAFKQAGQDFLEAVEAFVATYQGHLTSEAQIIEALKAYQVILRQQDKLGAYASFQTEVDALNEQANELLSFIRPILAEAGAELAFLPNELLRCEEKTLEAVGEAYPDSALYLKELQRAKPHRLSEEQEALLAALHEQLYSHYPAYRATKFKDMTFPDFTVDGQTYPNSYVLFENAYEMSPDTDVRRTAFKGFHEVLKKYRHTTAQQYIDQVRLEKKVASLRGFTSVIDYLLFDQQVERDFMDRQLDILMEKLAPVMRRYAGLIQKQYGLSEMTIQDIKMPLFKPDQKVSIPQAQEQLKAAFQIFGEDYVQMIEQAFKERWIDFPINLGKSTGGFCATVYDGPSYILLSWTGLMNELLVLAHELGHAGHFQRSNAHNAILVPEVSLYCIEAPSTANEVIMCQHLLEEIESPRERQALIAEFVSRTYFHNMVTHLLEAYFQREVYQLVDDKKHLDANDLDRLMRETLEKFWGDALNITPGAELTWMRQPHYYMGLYSYTYSAGLTIGTQVGLKMLQEPKKYAEKWLAVLQAGGQVSPVEFASQVDVDITTEKPLLDTIAYVDHLVQQLEA